MSHGRKRHDGLANRMGRLPPAVNPKTPHLYWLASLAFLRLAGLHACSGVVAVVVAAADETSHAEARLAKPSQASQSREGLTNGIGYIL